MGAKFQTNAKSHWVAKIFKRKKIMGKWNITKLNDFDHAIIGFRLGGLDQLLLKSMARCECKSKGAKLPSCIVSSLQTSKPWHQLHAFVHICFYCALSFYTFASFFSLLLQHVHFAFDLHCKMHILFYTHWLSLYPKGGVASDLPLCTWIANCWKYGRIGDFMCNVCWKCESYFLEHLKDPELYNANCLGRCFANGRFINNDGDNFKRLLFSGPPH